MNIKKLIGSKAFYRHVFMVAIPIIVQNFVTNFVGLLDNLMVGQVGTDQMNGVAIVNQLLFVFNLCVWGAVSGGGIFTVQYFGKKDHEGIRNTFRAKILFVLMVCIGALSIFTVFGSSLIQKFLHETDGIGNAAATLYYGSHYLQIMMIGLLPFCITSAYANTLRDVEETVIPMVASITAVVVNLVLNFVLIFGHFGAPQMGVLGAGVATVVSRYIEAGIVVWYAHSHKQRFPFMEDLYKTLKIPVSLLKQIIIKGAPLAINEFLWGFGMTYLNQLYSLRGLSVVGAFNISSTISNLFSVVYFGLGDAVAIIIGPYLGAGEMEKAKEEDSQLIAFSVVCCLAIGAIMALLHNFFPSLYNTEAEVKALAGQFIIVVSVMMPFYAFLHGSYFTLRTGGQSIVTFLFDSVFMWCIAVPIAWLCIHKTSLPIVPVYMLVCSADLIKCIIGYILLKKEVWLKNIVESI